VFTGLGGYWFGWLLVWVVTGVGGDWCGLVTGVVSLLVWW